MSQVGYGHSDPVGSPFDFYAGAVGVAAGTTYTMASSTLVLAPAAAVQIGLITLPLNPPDGCEASISNVGSGGVLTLATTTPVAANSGDTLNNGTLGVPVTITLAASAAGGSAVATLKYKYTLNGFVAGNSQVPGAPVLNARTWFRVQ
jgi:hypothetical protein